MTIPYELDEAARVDGASDWRIWLQILLPLSGPVVATIMIFSFISNWNDFMGPLIYLNSMDKRTVALGLANFKGLYSSEWNLMMAASTVTVIPILLLFFFAQRYFMKGIVMTGMAGR
jgi:multiple sugar transport system permease protein